MLHDQSNYLHYLQEVADEGIKFGRAPVEQASITDLREFSSLTDSERLAGNLHVAYRENAKADYEWVGFEQAISDMIIFNNGELPRCVA